MHYSDLVWEETADVIALSLTNFHKMTVNYKHLKQILFSELWNL